MAPPSEKSVELGSESTSPPGTITNDDFPDGGLRAWLVVLGSACGTLSTFGLINSFGVFQTYYEETLLPDVSPSDIAWIGSLQYALVFLPGLVTGRLFDIGYFRLPLFVASVLLIVSTFLVAQCTQYWHFVLCQGIAVGLACGFVFGPCMSVVGHWFRRKRGIALGIIAIGSSIGGTMYPIAARRLITEVGFPWTMRILGFILILTITVANLAMKRRLPPGKNVTGGLFNPRAFKSASFSVYSAACFFAFLGLYTVLIYLEVSAVSVGVSEDFAFYLISIANASSLFGRLTSAAVTDKMGPVNFVVPMSVVAAVVTFVWPFAKDEKSLIAIAILYGFSSAAFVSSFLMPLYELGEISDLGRRIGMVMSVSAIGALAGPPISGAINNASGGFEMVGYYAGSTVIVAVVLMLLTRHLVLKKMYGKF